MPYARRYAFVTLLIVLVAYLWGVGRVQIPKIGDEVLYLQIARVTGESGSWLPLKYEEGVFSTKPPLLYWLGISSAKVFGNSLWAYRLPVLLATFLSAWIIYLLGIAYLRNRSSALISVSVFLGFISTFQHGRPFLVNSFEVLFLLFPLLIFYRKPQFTFINWVLIALSWGAVSWSKSFALIPVGFLSLIAASYYLVKTTWLKRCVYFGSAATLSLCIFALWFVFDPDPQLLFQQFVVGENAVKFKGYAHYFSGLFVGSYTLFRIWLGPLANAGLYVLPVGALVVLLFKKRHLLPANDKALIVFMLAFLVFYSLPTQRQENYLLPLMGVLALLLVKYRDALPSQIWRISLGITDFVFIGLSLAPLVLSLWGSFTPFAKVLWVLCVIGYPMIYFIWDTKYAFPLLVLMCFIQLTNFSDPFNKQFKSFEQSSAQVWVPTRKLAQHERFRFMAPGAIPRAYWPEQATDICKTLKEGEWMVLEEADLKNCARSVEKVEEILDFKTRQKPKELLMIALGKSDYLVRKLYLIKALGSAPL